jgi:anti-sigma factor RsiW
MKSRKCRYILKLNAYLDKELLTKDKIELEKHIANCSQCREELADLKKISLRLNSYKDIELPSYMAHKIMAGVQEMNVKNSADRLKRFILSFTLSASVAASLLIGITLSNYTFKSDGSQDAIAFSDFGEESLYTFFEGEY